MPKFHTHDNWDEETNAPSCNFTYDFEMFEYYVSDSWQEVLCHEVGSIYSSHQMPSSARTSKRGFAGESPSAFLAKRKSFRSS